RSPPRLIPSPTRLAADTAAPLPFLSGEAGVIIGVVLIIVGLALAFWGHGIWSTIMSLIGALLGAAVGFLVGASLSANIAVGLILALVGAIIGSILFTKLVKVALAFLVGLLAGAAVYGVLGGRAQFTAGQIDPPPLGALLVLVVVFRFSYYFIADIIGILSASICSLLVPPGTLLLGRASLRAGLRDLALF